MTETGAAAVIVRARSSRNAPAPHAPRRVKSTRQFAVFWVCALVAEVGRRAGSALSVSVLWSRPVQGPPAAALCHPGGHLDPRRTRILEACVKDLDTVLAVFTDGEEQYYLQQLRILAAAVLAKNER